jgi:hypothetical protein
MHYHGNAINKPLHSIGRLPNIIHMGGSHTPMAIMIPFHKSSLQILEKRVRSGVTFEEFCLKYNPQI